MIHATEITPEMLRRREALRGLFGAGYQSAVRPAITLIVTTRERLGITTMAAFRRLAAEAKRSNPAALGLLVAGVCDLEGES